MKNKANIAEEIASATLESIALERYSLIGDCHSAALISANGAIDWLCFPTFSSASVFAALLDPTKGGNWLLQPVGEFTSSQSYISDTNVLQTTFECASGTAVLTDCFVIPNQTERDELSPERELLRTIRCVTGEVEFEMRFAPRANYGRKAMRMHFLQGCGWQCRHRGMDAILQTAITLRAEEHSKVLTGKTFLQSGEFCAVSWSYADREICALPPLSRAAHRTDATITWWREWSSQCTYKGLHADQVRRSLLTLKLLTSSLSGAVIAAPTTSLPEEIGGSRNWDYRFCWIRDSALAMRAFLSLGCTAEAIAFQRWLLRAVRVPWSKLQVVYDLWGGTHLQERELKHLSGYCDSRPVRIGNAASTQFQADLYGELFSTTAHFVSEGGALSIDERKLLRTLGARVLKLWRKPDQGIWEKRSPPQHHTFSKAMCWVALENLLRIDEKIDLRLPADLYRREQEFIRDEIERCGFDSSLNAYVSHYGSTESDASLLLLPRYGYVAADDPKMRGTFAMIDKTLTQSPWVWRYRTASADSAAIDDGIQGTENAFLPCAFWAVEYLALAGEVREAHRRLAIILECSSATGLFSEEYSPHLRRLLGNYPQALTHESLIGAILTLDHIDKHHAPESAATGDALADTVASAAQKGKLARNEQHVNE